MRRAATLFLTLTWLAALAPVFHAHHGEAQALYDEKHCPLSELAASDKEIKAAPGVDLVQPSPAIELVLLPRRARISGRALRRSSRAALRSPADPPLRSWRFDVLAA
jgi:hypothetical protein